MRIVADVAGVLIVVAVWLTSLRTAFTPNGRSSFVARWTARLVGAAMLTTARKWVPGSVRQDFLGYAFPVMIFSMGFGWLAANAVGFMLLAWGAEGTPMGVQGLGISVDVGAPVTAVTLAARVSAVFLVTAFINYLLRTTAAYSRREQLVCRLAAQAASTPDADVILADYIQHGESGQLGQLFVRWSDWLADVQATHLAYPALVYYPSSCDLSWSQAAQIVLDCAALAEACAPRWAPSETGMLLKAAAHLLPRLAGRMNIHLPPVPVSHQGREMYPFDLSARKLHSAGLELETTIDEAEAAFTKYRVRYAPFTNAISERLLSPHIDL